MCSAHYIVAGHQPCAVRVVRGAAIGLLHKLKSVRKMCGFYGSDEDQAKSYSGLKELPLIYVLKIDDGHCSVSNAACSLFSLVFPFFLVLVANEGGPALSHYKSPFVFHLCS
ncbi:hypothetical protein BKA93DRAFT_750686 [Sparassis latifolia]